MRSSGTKLATSLRGKLFSTSAANGLIATFGIAIMNGVVRAIYIRDLKASGLGARDAATHAAAMPLPPMIMMAQVAARGSLPMARSTRAGAEIQRPLVTVVIGGLISATLLRWSGCRRSIPRSLACVCRWSG